MIIKRRLKFLLFHLVGNLLTFPAISAGSLSYFDTQTLRIANPGYIDDLGFSLDAGGDSLISGAINVKDAVGKDVGAAYVYRRDSNDIWVEDARLAPKDGEHNDAFGWTVGIDGQSAIVGVPWDDDRGDSSGSAYIFANRNSEGWRQIVKLVSGDGGASELFGGSVDLSGKVAVVGAFRHDDSPAPGVRMEKGAVYVYEENDIGNWIHSTKLQANDARYGDHFGYRIAVNGDTLVATAPSAKSTNSNWDGAAYIFRKIGDNWTQIARLSSQDSLGSGWFGVSVAIGDGSVLVGAQGMPGTDSHGGAYIFEEGADGVWTQTMQLIPSDIGQRYYGLVGLDDDLAVVGAGSPSGANDWVVYVFQRDELGAWSEIATLDSPAGAYDFGYSLGIDGRFIFAGSGLNSAGAVHVFAQVPEPSSLSFGLGVLALVFARWQRMVPQNWRSL